MAPKNQEVLERTVEAADVPSRKCPICGHGEFAVSGEIHIAGTVDVEHRAVDPVQGILLVAAVCQRCGNVQFFSPQQLGTL